MQPQDNSPHVWDHFWADIPQSAVEDRLDLERERMSARWMRLRSAVVERLGTVRGVRAIEVGAGSGTYAALMASEGAVVSVLDYSPVALERAAQFFRNTGFQAELLERNALALDHRMFGQYDVSMSFGLAEHFTGSQRVAIFKAHLDLLKSGGICFISVPNAYNLPYRLYKIAAEVSGRWRVAKEYPFTRGELFRICEDLHVRECGIFGESLSVSLGFVNPLHPRFLRALGIRAKTVSTPAAMKQQRGTPFDAYLSYALVLYAIRPA